MPPGASNLGWWLATNPHQIQLFLDTYNQANSAEKDGIIRLATFILDSSHKFSELDALLHFISKRRGIPIILNFWLITKKTAIKVFKVEAA